jgi:putative membrane protein
MVNSNSAQKNYRGLIIALSFIIPLAVAALFKVKIDAELPVFLPPIYATINGITAVMLIAAVWAIKNGKCSLHEKLMKSAAKKLDFERAADLRDVILELKLM